HGDREPVTVRLHADRGGADARLSVPARAPVGHGAGARARVSHVRTVRVPRLDGQLSDLDLPGRRAEQDLADPDAPVSGGEPGCDRRRHIIRADLADDRRAARRGSPRRAPAAGGTVMNGARDFRGYGGRWPDPAWPDGARIAVSFVVNVEEGAELARSSG